MTEELSIAAAATLAEAMVFRTEVLRVPAAASDLVWLPRRDGVLARAAPGRAHCAEYVLGEGGIDPGCTRLALPLVDLPLAPGWRAAVFTDPLFSSGFTFRAEAATLTVAVGWQYSPERVPFSAHERRIHVHVYQGGPADALDAFLEHEGVSRVPAWLAEIRMVYFDYLSDGGQGWYRDLEVLAALVAPESRGEVAVALHGWYDRIGEYAFDHRRRRFHDRWLALEGRYGADMPMTVDEVRRRLRHARSLGFRVLLYFADGTVLDTATERGGRHTAALGHSTWAGPEVAGTLCIQDPADPEVRAWFHAYLQALLGEFGGVIDGLVWDETFWVRPLAVGAEAAYPAPAMMTLVRELTEAVAEHDPRLAFLVSDTIGHQGNESPPTAILAHGTFQDSECGREAWSYGLFPSWRKPLWSAIWGARRDFAAMKEGVLRFGAPVSLSNGWADDVGPSELANDLITEALELYLHRGAVRPGFLEEEPKAYLARPLPAGW